MKDMSRDKWEENRPRFDATTFEFCLEQLDAGREHSVFENVVDRLTFEELIWALLLARNDTGTSGYIIGGAGEA